jgi:ribosomal protein S18 acetylase RimI-like enzyme
MTAPACRIRALTAADEPLLWEAVYHAIYVPEGQSPPPRSIIDDPNIARYVRGWGREGDLGFAADVPGSKRPLGACWLRLWTPTDRGYGYVDPQTAELSLAVWPGHRAQGIGTRLLRAALDEAEQRFPAVSLSVTAINPAVRLYDRTGFKRVGEQFGTVLMVRKREE